MPPNLLQVGPLNEPLYYGSLYFAAVVSSAFYGITCVQTFFYHVHYRNDPLRIKSFVTALWMLNTAHEGLTVAGVYKYLMAGLLNPISILDDIPELMLLLTALVAIMTQGYFVYRIYLFSDKNVIAPFIWIVLAVIQFVLVTIYVCKTLYSADGSIQAVTLPVLNSNRFMSLATICLALAAGVDVLVAIFLTFLLVHKRRATGYSSTAHVLQRLTVFAVNTGIWTTLFALLSVILLHVFPSNLIHAVFVVPLCPVYCNTLLANLNVRAYVRGEATAHDAGGDLFTSATSPMSNIPEIDRHRGLEESNLVSSTHQQGVWKTTKVVTFIDAIRPTAAESA